MLHCTIVFCHTKKCLYQNLSEQKRPWKTDSHDGAIISQGSSHQLIPAVADQGSVVVLCRLELLRRVLNVFHVLYVVVQRHRQLPLDRLGRVGIIVDIFVVESRDDLLTLGWSRCTGDEGGGGWTIRANVQLHQDLGRWAVLRYSLHQSVGRPVGQIVYPLVNLKMWNTFKMRFSLRNSHLPKCVLIVNESNFCAIM